MALAALIVLAAFVIEIKPAAEVGHPFTVRTIEAGQQISPADIEIRSIPAGLLPPVTSLGYATHPIGAGEPLTAGAVTSFPPPPQDWWLVTVPLPVRAVPGAPARIVTTGAPPIVVDAIVATPGATDDFGGRVLGSVAVPPDAASVVARAAADGSLVVLTRP